VLPFLLLLLLLGSLCGDPLTVGGHEHRLQPLFPHPTPLASPKRYEKRYKDRVLNRGEANFQESTYFPESE
jgi:hypothetical protein